MADVVLNKLSIVGPEEQLKGIKDFFTNENGEFKFSLEKLLPTPKGLLDDVISSCVNCISLYISNPTVENKLQVEISLQGRKSFDEVIEIYNNLVKEYGTADWFWWRVNNWGCKWDADLLDVDITEEEVFIEFETPWNCPVPVIKILSEKFPECSMLLRYADEDLGCNCGWYDIKNGSILSDMEMSYEEAKEFWGIYDEEE